MITLSRPPVIIVLLKGWEMGGKRCEGFDDRNYKRMSEGVKTSFKGRSRNQHESKMEATNLLQNALPYPSWEN